MKLLRIKFVYEDTNGKEQTRTICSTSLTGATRKLYQMADVERVITIHENHGIKI